MAQTTGNKTIFKNSLFLYARIGIVMLVSLYTSRILLKALGVDDYGVYNVVGSVVMMFSSIRGLFISSTQRFMNFEMGRGDQRDLNDVFTASMTIHLVLCLIFLAIVEPVGLYFINYKLTFANVDPWIVHALFQMSVASSVIVILTVPYEAVIIANQKMSVYAGISILETLLKLGAAFTVLTLSSHKLLIYGVLILGVSLLLRFISWMYCRRYAYVKFRINRNKSRIKQMSSYAGWNFFGNMTFSLANEGQNLLLNMYFGPVANAARGIAYQVRNAFYQLTTNLNLAFAPGITQSYAQNDKERVTQISSLQLRSSVYIIACVVIPVYFYIDRILNLWLTVVPEYTAEIIRCLLVLVLIKPFAVTCDTIFLATAKLKLYQLLSAAITASGLVASIFYLLVKPNLLWVFWIYNIAAFINVIKSYILLAIHNDVDFFAFLKSSVLSVLCIIAICVIDTGVYNLPCGTSFVAGISLMAFINVAMAVGLFMTRKERLTLKGFITRKKM